jgi:formyl-CoA transferase
MGALSRVRILDLTQYEAGTSCTQTLAWLGADVVKVEQPGVGDPGRGIGALDPSEPQVDSIYFLNLNGNKRSVALNLRCEEGRDLFLRLLPSFDVVVENFSLGLMEGWGLGYDRLKEAHPPLIYATIKGFGTTGPYSSFRCFDQIAQAMGGGMSVTGTSETPPFRAGPTYGDTGTGMKLAIGILAAYIQRLETGEGQHVEVAMQEAIASYARVVFTARDRLGDPVGRIGNEIKFIPPSDTYPCKPFGPNDWVYLMVVTGQMLENLALALERPDLCDDPRYRTQQARVDNAEELKAIVRDWCSTRTKHEVMEHLQRFGVPAGAVMDSGDIFNNPHLKARGFLHVQEHPKRDAYEILGNPIRLSASPTTLRRAPLLGEHTDQVLAQELGLSEAEIGELRARKAVG